MRMMSQMLEFEEAARVTVVLLELKLGGVEKR